MSAYGRVYISIWLEDEYVYSRPAHARPNQTATATRLRLIPLERPVHSFHGETTAAPHVFMVNVLRKKSESALLIQDKKHDLMKQVL